MPKEKQSSALALVDPETIQKIDQFADDNNLAVITDSKKRFAATFALANAMEQLKTLLTADVMKPILALQGSPLGFRTDKDRNGGYQVEVVRDCLIHVTINGGFLPFGNEFNIIAGNAYITRQGFEGWFKRAAEKKVCTYPVVQLSLPKTVAGGAIVTATATCKKGEQTIELRNQEIPVKGDAHASDLLLGKAKRKILARLYELVTGTQVNDADLSDGAIDLPANETGRTEAPANPNRSADGDAPTEGEFDAWCVLCGPHADKVTEFLIENNRIKVGETYKDAPATSIRRALGNKDAFREAVGITGNPSSSE